MKTKLTLIALLTVVLTACPFVMTANAQTTQNTTEPGVYCESDPNEIHHGE